MPLRHDVRLVLNHRTAPASLLLAFVLGPVGELRSQQTPRCYEGILGTDQQARRIIVSRTADSTRLTFYGRPSRTVALSAWADASGVERWQSPTAGATRYTVTFDGDSAVLASVSATRSATGVLRRAPALAGLSALDGAWDTEVGPGGLLRLSIRFRSDACALVVGTLDSPDQGQRDLPLTDVSTDGDSITIAARYLGLRIRVAHPAVWDDVARDGLRGSFEQNGAVQALTLRRRTSAWPSARPQEPVGPLPYAVRDVRFPSKTSGVQLHGTLTLPTERGPHPAVVLISGSGAQDRDESIAGHRPFLVLADHLTRHGFAVLRTDDRGFGNTGHDMLALRLDDLVDDVWGALAFLRAQPEIDHERIGLLGHSEGGFLAAVVSARDTAVRFVVLLAGPAVPGRTLLLSQRAALMRASGASASVVGIDSALLQTVFDVIAQRPASTDLAPMVDSAVARWLRGLSAPERATAVSLLQQRSASQDSASIALWNSPWFRSFFFHEPAAALAAMQRPILAIFGALDLQVPPEPNAEALRRAFSGVRERLLSQRTFPGLNHLMQPARTGLLEEYRMIETTIAPVVLTEITTWMVRHASPRTTGTPR